MPRFYSRGGKGSSTSLDFLTNEDGRQVQAPAAMEPVEYNAVISATTSVGSRVLNTSTRIVRVVNAGTTAARIAFGATTTAAETNVTSGLPVLGGTEAYFQVPLSLWFEGGDIGVAWQMVSGTADLYVDEGA